MGSIYTWLIHVVTVRQETSIDAEFLQPTVKICNGVKCSLWVAIYISCTPRERVREKRKSKKYNTENKVTSNNLKNKGKDSPWSPRPLLPCIYVCSGGSRPWAAWCGSAGRWWGGAFPDWWVPSARWLPGSAQTQSSTFHTPCAPEPACPPAGWPQHATSFEWLVPHSGKGRRG